MTLYFYKKAELKYSLTAASGLKTYDGFYEVTWNKIHFTLGMIFRRVEGNNIYTFYAASGLRKYTLLKVML